LTVEPIEQYTLLEIGDNLRQLVELVERLVELAERQRPKPRQIKSARATAKRK